jgi:hypothetical protein
VPPRRGFGEGGALTWGFAEASLVLWRVLAGAYEELGFEAVSDEAFKALVLGRSGGRSAAVCAATAVPGAFVTRPEPEEPGTSPAEPSDQVRTGIGAGGDPHLRGTDRS